jgi:formylglycine-generating enzyme required for sulfatase activity
MSKPTVVSLPPSRAALSRADLARLLAAEGVAGTREMAGFFGYRHTPTAAAVAQDEPAVTAAAPPPVFAPVPDTEFSTKAQPAARFFCVTERRATAEAEQAGAGQAPDWYENATLLERDERPDPAALRRPTHLPLTRWARLWPFLQRVLGCSAASRRPDLPRLVERLANGAALRRVPLEVRRRWSPRIVVLLDYNRRTWPFRQDFNALCHGLERLHGAAGLAVYELCGAPAARPMVRRDGEAAQPWQWPAADTPVLVLSDLGCLDTSLRSRQGWLQFGRRARAAGIAPLALCPAAGVNREPGLAALFGLYAWDRHSRLRRMAAMAPGEAWERALATAESLLTLLAPAVRLEPGLLRAARYLLPADEADAAAEALAWLHPDLASSTLGACVREREAVERYQTGFAALPADWQTQAVGLIQRHHAHLPAAVRYAELDACARLAPGCLDQDTRAVVRGWYASLAKTRVESPVPTLAQWAECHWRRQGGLLWRDNAPLAALWAVSARQRREAGQAVELPPEVRPVDVRFFLEGGGAQPVRPLLLYQQGEGLWLAGADSAIAGSPYARLDLAGDGVFVQRQDAGLPPLCRHFTLTNLPARLMDMAPETQRLELETATEVLTIAGLAKPSWASAMGRDTYGLFAELTFKNAIQRFRWIAPGRFLMGSPENEPERLDNEAQHPVTLTQGYWLADTACTQALWQAVKGDNPSGFKDDPDHPVENVSWDDVQGFLQRLNAAAPGLNAGLPTEAQWEYACRAGTATPFAFGANITSEQVNYDGGHPYADGAKGLYRQKTVPVRALPCNDWGLYQMHGNVWEWCLDWYGDYSGGEAVDPAGPDTGNLRVLRGGSWFNFGGRARSAYRSRGGPGHRYALLGFRLALGPQAGGGQAGEPTGASGRTAARSAAVGPDAPAGESEEDGEGGLLERIKAWWKP